MKNIIKYSIFCFLLTTGIVSSCPRDENIIISIENSNDLENLLLKNIGPCILYFYMQGCGWCNKMSPIIEDLATHDDFAPITFYQISGPSTDAGILVQKHLQKNLPGYPSIFFMHQGALIESQIGGAPTNTIKQKLNKLLYVSQKKPRKKVKIYQVITE